MMNELHTSELDSFLHNKTRMQPHNEISTTECWSKLGDLFKGINQKNEGDISQIKNTSFAIYDLSEKHDLSPEELRINELIKEYMKSLKEISSVPETINDEALDNMEVITGEALADKREEFNDNKKDLIREWEQKHGIEWPKYAEDVYSDNGKLIRKAGSNYDAHHIKPLCLGGKNEVDNITPLHAKDHFDSQGIHSNDGAYRKIVEELGGH